MANIVTEVFQSGFRLFTGEKFTRAFLQVNNALAGTAAIVINATGAFNGTIGGTTPALAAVTYLDLSTANALTALGSTRADALALTKAINNVTVVASGNGVILPSAAVVGIGGSVLVFNSDASDALKVYAAGSDTIDTVAGSTGVTLTATKRCLYFCVAANTFISAQLGVISA